MKKCLIICNGPSLNNIPDSLLNKYDTFGSNRVYLRYTPDYYACVNPLVLKQYRDDINDLRCVKFIPKRYHNLVQGAAKLHITSKKTFATSIDASLYEGYTVTYVLLQIAYWYGYDKVGLVGCDHRYKFSGKPNQKLTADGKDPNHFDPDYFADGAVWNAPDLVRSEESYKIAEGVYRKAGREIINLTKGSALDVFPKEDWREW